MVLNAESIANSTPCRIFEASTKRMPTTQQQPSAASPVQPEDQGHVSLSSYVYFGSIYSVFVGGLYLWGYWGTFGVNILEYLSLTDIVAFTIFPVVSGVLATFLGSILSHLYRKPTLPAGSDSQQTYRRLLTVVKIVLLVTGLALLIFGSRFFSLAERWLFLSMIIAFFASDWVENVQIVRTMIPYSSRGFMSFILCAIPLMTYSRGMIKGDEVISGKHYWYLSSGSGIPDLPVMNPDNEGERIKYLGHAGSNVFLLLPDNATLMILYSEKISALQIKERKQSVSSELSNSQGAPAP